MANQVILQSGSPGMVDILVKHEGWPSDHFHTCPDSEVDEWVEKAGGNLPGVEVVDHRKN